jgi:hypothetical protein
MGGDFANNLDALMAEGAQALKESNELLEKTEKEDLEMHWRYKETMKTEIR